MHFPSTSVELFTGINLCLYYASLRVSVLSNGGLMNNQLGKCTLELELTSSSMSQWPKACLIENNSTRKHTFCNLQACISGKNSATLNYGLSRFCGRLHNPVP